MFVQLRNISVSEDYKRENPRYKRDTLNCWILFQCPHCTLCLRVRRHKFSSFFATGLSSRHYRRLGAVTLICIKQINTKVLEPFESKQPVLNILILNSFDVCSINFFKNMRVSIHLGPGYKLPFFSDNFTVTAVVFQKASNDHNFLQSEIVNLNQ
jgi:hypothetical protein